jgi:FAD/FMN-containing dehydrogenase
MTNPAISALAEAIGDRHVQTGDDIEPRFRTDLRGTLHAAPLCVVRPGSTEDVSAVMRIATAHHIPVTTQGGRTNTVRGAMSAETGIVLSLDRMTRIDDLDIKSMTLTVQAGAPLQMVQEAAAEAGFLVPLDLGSRGSATIGGVISTNAGGLRAVRWGVAREMVLGLEAVLADGTVADGLKKMLKDNAGYDWKHLMIGSEGTLGVVTRATLRLRPMPATTMTAFCALQSFDDVYDLLRDLDRDMGGQITSFELMWPELYHLVLDHYPERTAPLPRTFPLYVLVEAMGGDPAGDPARFEAALGTAIESKLVIDAVIAQSERERADLWAFREDIGLPMRAKGPMYAFDVGVGLSDIPETVRRTVAAVRTDYPDAFILTYGHAGDGNLHFVIGVGEYNDAAERRVDLAVFGAVKAARGSISAEHGIGLAKRDDLHFSRRPGEIALMRTLKRALDPDNILNPGKVINMDETFTGPVVA